MPLWSTEEWRARIGSCWCALGRPFNTRFTRCRGKSRGMLTLHQVATMVIMMMLLIAANLGLAATQGHHKMFMSMLLFGDVIMELHAFRFGLILILLLPILKMNIQLIYHLLPHRTKTSLKQFYVDLTHCFQLIGYIMWMISRPAMYVINSVTSGIGCLVQATTEPFMKWTQNDDMPSQGNPMGSLVVVILVAIQLFMTVAVARSVIYFLLLTSGDVEQNPGPPTQTEGPGASRTYYQGTGLLGVLLPRHLLVSMNSVQPASSVYIVGAVHVAIAIVVTMALEVATAVQASILLRCGDIELNPGPLGREDPSQGDVHPLIFSEDMSYEQLVVWLTNHPRLVGRGYQQDISKLRDARINGFAFLILDEEMLEQLGVTIGFKFTLMSIIEDLKRTQQPQTQNGTFSTAPSSYTTKVENVFDQLPTLDELLILKYTDRGARKKLIRIISEASHKWKNITNLICDDVRVITVLEQKYHSDPEECLRQAFIDHFINKKPHNYSQDWNGLIELLDDVGLETLAEYVKLAVTCAGGTFSATPFHSSSFATKAENVFDELPTLDKLLILKYMDKGKKKKLRIISEASHKWKSIANLISGDVNITSMLEQRCHGDPDECLKQIFISYFISKKPQRYTQDWNGLIELLDDVDLETLAEDVKYAVTCAGGTFSATPFHSSSFATKAENVFDELPTLDELLILKYMDKGKKKKLRIISEASHKWKSIANLISGDVNITSMLEQRCHGDPDECLKQIFISYFISKKPQRYTQDWNGLIELLDDVDLETLAEDVKYAVTCAGAGKPDYERELNLLLEKEGYVELTTSKLLITGAAGSGKTCTKHILYKLPPPGERVSTELLEQMDRAYVARGIDHDIAYYTESTECDWIIIHSDNHELYSMLAATVNTDRRSIGMVHDSSNNQQQTTQSDSPSSTSVGNNDQQQISPAPSSSSLRDNDQQEAIPAPSSSSLRDNDPPYPKETSQHETLARKSDGKKLLLEKMSDPKNVGKCVHQVHWIHFLDSGGQSAFHDILPAFVHNISVIIFVLKLSEAMDEQPFDDYYEGGERIGDTKKSPYQVKEILKSMIQSMCSEKSRSKLLIIGTHSDKISAKESLSDKNAIIKSLLHSFVGHDQLDVLCHGSFDKNDILFSLNAKDQDEKSKEEAKTIRKRIVKSCKCTEPLKIPISWFLLEEDLRISGMHHEHGIINTTKCQPVARSLNITSLSDALEYFHSLNVFLYFPNSQLSNLVFTKPQIVVTIVSRFVKIAYKLRGELTNTQFINYSKQGQFTKDLILHEEDIARFIDHDVGFEIEQMIELLRITFVVAPISEGKYFIPCVLNYCPPDEIKKQVSTQCVAPMVIKLPGECVPRGFFCAFVCSLLSQWKLHHIGHEFAKVFKNFIHFDIEGVGYSVVVVDSFFYISVHVFGTCGRKGCNKIQELVKMSVKEIIAKHKYKNNVFCNDSILFLCPCGKAPEHFTRLITEESLESDELLRLKCAMQDQPLDLTEEYAVWLSEEQYSKWSKQVGGVAAKQQSQVHTGPQSLQRTVEEVIAIIPTANHWKLDKEIDFANLNEQGETIPRHLGTIATSMINWQICIADELGLTEPERVDVVQGRHPFNPGLQRREVLNIWRQKHGNRATYRALITAFVKADRRDCADRVCQTLLESATVAGATHDMSEYDFFKWLTRKGLSEKDSKTMKEEGITATIFKELDSDDLKELKAKLTFGGKRRIEKLHKKINSE